MINVPQWDQRRQRYEEYWNRTNKTPLLFITAEADKQYPIELHEIDSKQWWFDCDYKIQSARAYFKNTYFGGDSYPHVMPTVGADVMASSLGLNIIYNDASVWVEHKDCPLSEFQDFTLNKEDYYYKKLEEVITRYVEDAKNGDYIVGMADMGTLLDGVSSLIGAERLCLEMMDHPEEVKRVTEEHFKLFQQVYTNYNNIVTKYQGGNTNWLSIYSDIPWYFISIDVIVMLSGAFFEEFVDESLRKMVDFHDRTLFHLDGENAVMHLDRILKVEKLTGVQVQATPFVQSAEFWIPHLKKIQAAGKNIWVEARHKQDVKDFIENLEPEGLFIKTWTEDEWSAKDIEAMVNRYYGVK